MTLLLVSCSAASQAASRRSCVDSAAMVDMPLWVEEDFWKRKACVRLTVGINSEIGAMSLHNPASYPLSSLVSSSSNINTR